MLAITTMNTADLPDIKIILIEGLFQNIKPHAIMISLQVKNVDVVWAMNAIKDFNPQSIFLRFVPPYQFYHQRRILKGREVIPIPPFSLSSIASSHFTHDMALSSVVLP